MSELLVESAGGSCMDTCLIRPHSSPAEPAAPVLRKPFPVFPCTPDNLVRCWRPKAQPIAARTLMEVHSASGAMAEQPGKLLMPYYERVVGLVGALGRATSSAIGHTDTFACPRVDPNRVGRALSGRPYRDTMPHLLQSCDGFARNQWAIFHD